VRGRVCALAWLAGCGPDDGDDKTSDSTDEHTGTLPTTFDGFVPFAFGVTAADFAVSPEGDAAPWTGADGSPRAARLTVSIADDTVATAGWAPGHFCAVTWSWSVPTPAATAPTTAAWRRWTPDPATATVEDGCADLEFPPAWGGDVRGVLEGWTFGFGLGPLDPQVREALEVAFGDEFAAFEPYIGGGGFYWDGLRGQQDLDAPDRWRTGWVDTGVVYGFELDADGREVLAGGQPVTVEADGFWDGTTVAPGRYQLQGTTLLTPATALLR
jgi:hypothetical protein